MNKLKHGPCAHEECKRKAKHTRHCQKCDHTIAGCGKHAEWSMNKMKVHVMRKHPGVLPALVLAALKGEDVF